MLALFVIIAGVILIGISAFWSPPKCSFWNLGWALVLTGVLLLEGHSVAIR
jgi:hypothetical protein